METLGAAEDVFYEEEEEEEEVNCYDFEPLPTLLEDEVSEAGAGWSRRPCAHLWCGGLRGGAGPPGAARPRPRPRSAPFRVCPAGSSPPLPRGSGHQLGLSPFPCSLT